MWIKKVKIGGIICGHNGGEFRKNIRDAIGENTGENNDYIFKYRKHNESVMGIGYPGVIKALDNFFGDNYSILPNSTVWYYVKN